MNKSKTIRLRCTPKQKALMEGLAKLYADGNLSALILDWVLEGPTRRLVRTEEEKRARAKAPARLSS